MNREEIIELAEQCKFRLSEEEIKILETNINNKIKGYEKLTQIETENVEPMFSPLDDIVVNRFGSDENIFNEEYKKMYTTDKMVDDFYQVPNKEGN